LILVVPYDDRDENNRFKASFDDDEILDFIKLSDDPTTGDVAREFECSQQNAYYRLTKLRDRGAVQSRKIGNANVWTVDETDRIEETES